MAFYDDHRFLLSHIHHSFITCDDTGMCEMAMLNEVVTDKFQSKDCQQEPQEKILNYYSEAMESELLEAGQSYDVTTGIGFIGGHRHRSNTAQRLERLRKEKQMQAKIAYIQWKEYPSQLSEKELCELFPKKDLNQEKKQPVKSALSEALELFPAVANNPFNEYARFDGRINRNVASKKILIYMMMLPPEERNYGMEVICLSSARVQELIGLICWMYTCEGKQPKLQPPVSNYCLKIAEETGEVDEDFPNLDGNEFVGKFGFPYLALIERANKSASILVTVHINDEIAKVEVPNLDMTLREVADLASQKVAVTESKAYHMEKPSEPCVPVPLDLKLVNFNSLDFNLVFEEDVRNSQQSEFLTEEYDSHMRAVEAPLYRSYNVCQIQKMGINFEVQLGLIRSRTWVAEIEHIGISGEKVEIHPLPPKGAAKILSRPQKPTVHYMNSMANCEIISKKYSPGRCIFKLVHYTGTEFKKYTFEADPSTAQEIVKKVQIILEMHSSNASKEYQLYRERKLQKKVQRNQQTLLK